jgi:hypothetical protein
VYGTTVSKFSFSPLDNVTLFPPHPQGCNGGFVERELLRLYHYKTAHMKVRLTADGVVKV